MTVAAVHGNLREIHGLVLVVDDNEMNRDVLTQRLTRQGHQVETATNGVEALDAMRTHSFDLVLLDIMMPEIDGYEVLQHIKSDTTNAHIPVIMISALNEMSSVIRCIELGADDYLCKPFDVPLLKARVGACLERKQSHDSELRLTFQLEQSLKRLGELEKRRGDLTNLIVDDLRIPLSSMLADVEELSSPGDFNDHQSVLAARATASGQAMMTMVADLLDIDSFEAGSMEIEHEALNPADLVASAIGRVARISEARHVTLRWEIEDSLPHVYGDRDKLSRALANLLENAIQFSRPSGTVTVESSFERGKPSIIFAVRDTGEGIPQQVLDHIFEKFGRVGTRHDGRVVSTGLGLAFCKMVVEAHEGEISVQSHRGKGSRFQFSVPVFRAAA